MLKIIKLSIKISFFVALMLKQSFASAEISNSSAINMIEKILISPQDEAILDRKSEIEIDKTADNIDDQAPIVAVTIVDKMDDKANRTKEKMAYNAIISGHYEVALELYKQIVRSERNNNYAKFGMATSYQKLKQYKQAKKIYYKLLSEDIDNKEEVIANFLEILVEEAPKDAQYVLARLTAQSPNSDYILARSAISHNNLGRKQEAILLLKRAVAINPKPDYHLNLAIILDGDKQYYEAIKYYKKVINSYVNGNYQNDTVDLASIKNRISFIKDSELRNL